ncbi:MAG TPA: hypothetical protein VIL65_11580 [Beijerinckiaceae bacterium]|jgi:DNA-binding CsgD family transcriptional regulator
MDDRWADLIDRIYEAAIVGDRWVGVLDTIAGHAGCEGGVMFAVSPQGYRWAGSDCLVESSQRFLAEGWDRRNGRLERALASQRTGFVVDHDLFTPDELETEPVYGFFRSVGLGYCTGLLVQVPGDDMIVFDFARRHALGPLGRADAERLDVLHPHLSRAALLSARLGLERARATAQMLELLGLPAAVLSGSRRVLAANPRMEAMMPQVLQDRRQRATLSDARADRLLGEALARLDAPGAAIGSLPLAAQGDQPPIVAHLVPVRRDARDVLTSASAILVFTPVGTTPVAGAELIRALFDLTPAEARVARAVVHGGTVGSIAASVGVAPGTVRQQLKAVFAKTGVGRQADLTRLLSSLTLARDGGG